MNWGKGLIISMTIFIVFIVGLGFYMINNNDALYEQDYYAKGEAHTETMAAESAAVGITVNYVAPELTIQLGEEGYVQKVTFKHMGDSKFDRVIINPNDKRQEVFALEVPQLKSGLWYVEVSGTLGGKAFFKKTKLVI